MAERQCERKIAQNSDAYAQLTNMVHDHDSAEHAKFARRKKNASSFFEVR